MSDGKEEEKEKEKEGWKAAVCCVFLGFCFPMNSATFLFAKSINSSISLFASLDSLKKIQKSLLMFY